MDSAQGEGVTSKSRKYEQVQIWQCYPYMENQMLALSFKSPQLQGENCPNAGPKDQRKKELPFGY